MPFESNTFLPLFAQAQSPGGDAPKRYGGLEQAADRFRDVGEGSGMEIRWLIAATVIICGALLIAVSYNLYRSRDQRSRPLWVFNRAAKDLRLSLSDKWLLGRIALFHRLPSPLVLILSPVTLHAHAADYASHLTMASRLRVMKRIRTIRKRMVG